MGYFHKIPSSAKLRSEAIKRVEEYFEETELNLSSLSLLSIIIPENKPLRNYPSKNGFTYLCVGLYNWAVTPCAAQTRAECREDCLEIYPHLLTFPCLCWCNIGYLLDYKLEEHISSRLDLVRLSFLIYEEGVFAHRRKLEEVRCKWLCYCLYAVQADEAELGVSNEEIHFVPWDQIDLSREPKQMNEFCDSTNFVSPTEFCCRREMLDILRQFETQFKKNNWSYAVFFFHKLRAKCIRAWHNYATAE
eukprot:snap_masked-scaffold_56-processed-gene-0.30-mRNA-1 protein AED:1.00 eAED:1.00 QI:0/0/0/0/1/1/3/0/247